MENPFKKIRADLPLNVIPEVGRDPLRVPVNTPPGEVINVAIALAKAREQLTAVLPQPNRETTEPSTPAITQDIRGL